MKSATDWADDLDHISLTPLSIHEIIQRIQADAMRHAAQVLDTFQDREKVRHELMEEAKGLE